MTNTPAVPTQPVADRGPLHILERTSFWSSLVFERIAVLGIIVMIVVTTIDVIGAKFFDKPLRAGTELVYFSQAIAIAGSLAFTKITGFHIRMEFIDALPKHIVRLARILASLLGLALFIVLAWKGFEYGRTLMINRDVTAAARVPLYPFVFWMALSCIPLCLVLLHELVKSVIGFGKR